MTREEARTLYSDYLEDDLDSVMRDEMQAFSGAGAGMRLGDD